MAYQSTTDQLIKVSTTAGGAGTYTAVKGITSFDDSGDTDITEEDVFGEADPVVGAKKNARTWDGEGIRDMADTTGQEAIRLAHDSGATIYVQDLHDGVEGTRYPVIVTAWNEQRARSNRFRRFSFSLRQNGAAVAVEAP